MSREMQAAEDPFGNGPPPLRAERGKELNAAKTGMIAMAFSLLSMASAMSGKAAR